MTVYFSTWLDGGTTPIKNFNQADLHTWELNETYIFVFRNCRQKAYQCYPSKYNTFEKHKYKNSESILA